MVITIIFIQTLIGTLETHTIMVAVFTWVTISGDLLMLYTRTTLNTTGILTGVGVMILGIIHMRIIHIITTLMAIIAIILITVGINPVIQTIISIATTKIVIMDQETVVYIQMEDVHPIQQWRTDI